MPRKWRPGTPRKMRLPLVQRNIMTCKVIKFVVGCSPLLGMFVAKHVLPSNKVEYKQNISRVLSSKTPKKNRCTQTSTTFVGFHVLRFRSKFSKKNRCQCLFNLPQRQPTNQPLPKKTSGKKKKNFRVILAHCCNKGGTKSSPRMQLLQLNSLWPPPETNSEWKSVGHIPTIHFQGLKILVSGRVRVVYVSFWSSRKKIRNNCENFGKKVSGQNVMFNKNILGNFWLIPKHGCLKWMDHDGPLQWKSSSCGENFGKFPFPAMVSVDLGCGKHVETPLEPPLLAAPPANLVIFSMFFSRITPKSSLHG